LSFFCISDPGGYVSNELLYVEVDVINNDVCVNAYGANSVPNSKMCISTAGGTEGPCHVNIYDN
jgi:hypothetical protein